MSTQDVRSRWRVVKEFPTGNALKLKNLDTGKIRYANTSQLVEALSGARRMAAPQVHNFQNPPAQASWSEHPASLKIGALETGERCLWELFAGTSSIGKAAEDRGWRVFAFEKDPKAAAKAGAICCDIEQHDFGPHPRPHAFWSSNPCAAFSVATTTALRNKLQAESVRLLKRTLELIAQFKPQYWFIENPAHPEGLEAEELMAGLPSYVTDYCMWGFPYKKTTRIWTNLRLREELPRCDHGVPHQVTLGGCYGGQGGFSAKTKKGRVPPKLCHHLLQEVETQLLRDEETPFTKIRLIVTTQGDERGPHCY